MNGASDYDFKSHHLSDLKNAKENGSPEEKRFLDLDVHISKSKVRLNFMIYLET